MSGSYISKDLIAILDLLSGSWSIYHYQLVHHGWVTTIQNLDSWPDKEPVELFLHSEEGTIEVRSSNQVDSKVLSKGLNNSFDIAQIIESNVT